MRTFTPRLCADFTADLTDLRVVRVTLDFAGNMYVLAVAEKDFERLYGRGTPKHKMLSKPHDFVVLSAVESVINRVIIPNQRWNYHFVQPMPENDLLLVYARSQYYAKDEYDLNAAVFAPDGTLKREFLLGDGIEHVQTTANGDIWTGYFDEGVIGNRGWTQPIGAPGLIQWDRAGNQQYAYDYAIVDCYALNVTSDRDTWLYYYTDFPLVHLHDKHIVGSWHSPIRGAHAFAIYENYVLFCGGYEQKNVCSLYELGENQVMTPVDTFTFIEDASLLTARGQRVALFKDGRGYYVDLEDLILSL